MRWMIYIQRLFKDYETLSDKENVDISISKATKSFIIYFRLYDEADMRNQAVIGVYVKTPEGEYYPYVDDEGIPVWGKVIGAGGKIYITVKNPISDIRITLTPLYTDYSPKYDLIVYEVLDEVVVR